MRKHHCQLTFATALSTRALTSRSRFIQKGLRLKPIVSGRVPFQNQHSKYYSKLSDQLKTSSGQIRAKSSASLVVPNEETTYSIGYIFGSDPRPSDVILLHGDLGAGKTAFARGYIHAAANDTSLQVTSPTFLLTNTYPCAENKNGSNLTIYHMDLWRLDDASSRPIVDFEHVFRDAVSLIEWPDRLKDLHPPECLDIHIDYPPYDTQSNSGDDPWGFGSGDPQDDLISQKNRFVRFIGHGKLWDDRIDYFYKQNVVEDENDNLVLNRSSIKSF